MRMVRTTSGPGPDNVPPALLTMLDGHTLKHLTCAFRTRMLEPDTAGANEASWKTSRVRCVAKPGKDHSKLSSWRPISVQVCLSKLYELWLWSGLEQYMRPRDSAIIGFEKSRQPMEVTHSLITALRKAHEWGFPLGIASMDVKSAFDEVLVEPAAAALRFNGAPEEYTAAIVRDMLGNTGHPSMGHFTGPAFRFEKGARQGAPRTPSLWNCMMNHLITEARGRWAASSGDLPRMVHWSEEVDEHHLLIWADNIYWMASSLDALQKRVQDVARGFSRAGLSFSPESLELLGNSTFPGGTLHLVPGGVSFRRVTTLVCLGVALDGEGSTSAQIQHRVDQARGAWFRSRALLQSKHLTHEERYRFLHATVGASALHGAGSWIPSVRARALLEQAEWRCLRWMAQERRAGEEPWLAFYSRRHRAAKAFREGAVATWWHKAVCASHAWYGHLRRHPSCPAARIQAWRDLPWWRTVQMIPDRGCTATAGRR